MLSIALSALALPFHIKHRSTLLASPQSDCPEGCAAHATVHGDPMFKVRAGQPSTHP
jgi:hypothetical protein